MITTTATATTTPPSDDPGTCSGSTTSSEEGGGLDGVGTELTKKGTVRQKRWTTRGRTGCLTCRARHIKCDEAKPYCRRCVSGRRECRGYDFGSPADAVRPVALHGGSEESTKGHDPSIIQEVVARRQRHYIAEPEPPDWECMEAARYYCVFVLPSCEEQLLTPFSDLPPFHGSNRSIFLLDVSSHRIADASKARGRRGAAAEEPSVDGAWATHSRQMVQILDMVNTGIADKTVRPTNKGNILRRIFTLLVFDLMVDASAWRPHLLGYLALVQHMGGVRALMRLNNEHMNNTQWSILIVAIAANTTSPANQQLRGFEAYTDRDIEFLSAIDVSHELPCPPPLLVVLKNLTQLRARLAEDRCPKTTVERAVRHLFDRISAFDHDTWVKTIHFDLGAEVATLSRIFQVAVRLFGVLSLPQSATVYWAVAASYPRLPGLSAYDSVRIAHRRELLGLLYPFRGTFTSVLALSWPVTVAGASLGGDGSAEDRKFIAESLLDMWQSRLARCGPILCLEKLQVFWAAGKTAWDDCFDEPVPPLA